MGYKARPFVLTCLIIVLLSAGSPQASGQGVVQKMGEAAASVYNSVTGETFTISKIEPKTADRTVRIFFTDSCDLESLRRNLKFIPPVPIEWHSSAFARETNTLTLRGQFKPGQRYVLVFPPQFKSAYGKTYARGVAGFTMPDRDPAIAFYNEGSVIERNSRQMLHVQLMNVNEVLVRSLHIPPALLPLAVRQVEVEFRTDWNVPQIAQKVSEANVSAAFPEEAARLKTALGNDGDFRALLGDVFEDKQLFFSQQEKNLFHQFSIPLTFRREKEKGSLELVSVASKQAEQTARTSFRLFRITDVGLTYKLSNDALLLWATSLYSGKPLKDVAFFGFTANEEVVPLGSGDSRGLLFVHNNVSRKSASLRRGEEGRITTRPLLLSEITMVAALTRDDVTYVNIAAQGNVKPEGVEQGRSARLGAAPAPMKAAEKAPVKKRKKAKRAGEPVQAGETAAVGFIRGHVFTERGIYRTSETVHFKGTVREYRDGTVTPPEQTSVTFKIVNSKNEEVYRKEMALSEFGTASDSVALKGYYPLGTYTLTMQFGGNEAETASRTFEVQEFRQPRHYVEIVYKRESRKDDAYVNLDMKKELLNCEINGKYYAGGPVKHGKVRWSIYHTKSDYGRQDYPGYTFGHPLESRTDLIESGESMLDEKGGITVPVPIGKDILSGKYGIEVAASVVDFDGRASSDSSVYQADPDFLVGISNHPPTVQPGENQTLYALVIDKKGNKISKGIVVVQVMERGYTYIQKRNEEGQLYHEHQQIWRSQLKAELPIRDDKAVFDFDFTRGGEYLIAFTYKDASGREYVSATKYTMPGYYYGYEYDGGRPDQARNYGKLSLYPEKPLYTAGETIKIYINPPREASTYLITVEKDSLVEFGTLEVKPGQQFFELPVKDAYGPNVYISVLGTVARSTFPVYTAQFDKEAPTFLFGTVNVEVKGGQQKLKIAVNEEQKKLKTLPGAEMTLNITTTDQAGKGVMSELAVAVVDESILSMTGFETPTLDSLGKFILPLGVFTGDLRLDLLKQTPYGFFRNMPLTGGDGEMAGSEAVTSKIRKDFNPVAYFNPSVRTDANGMATVKFKFPDTMTTYRVYAVACDKGSRFGSYQRPALVVKDFYMEPGLPAFLTRGDRFRFAVSAFNKTDKGGDVDFSVTSDDLLSLAVPAKSFSLAGFDRTLIPVDGTVNKAGTTTAQFAGRFKGLSDIVEMKLPVNSGHVLGNDTVFGNFRKTAQVSYTLPKAVKELRWEDTGPGEVKCVLTVSGSPFLRMSQGLRYFLRYPYGCVEQTSSGVLPIAALRDIIQKGLIPDITTAETDKFIKPGIDRLFSMQTPEGGFGYWPGDRMTHKWGSIYALTALTRAGLAGHELPKDRMDSAMAYLKDQIKASGRDEHTFRAFAAYILAQNRAMDRETFNKVFETIDSQPREAAILTLLAGKISRLLPDDTVKTRLRPVLERPWDQRLFVDEFYARYREPAISLLAANAVFPGEEVTHRLAAKLLGGMNQEGIWTSTSDSGWSLAALSEYFGGSKMDANAATVTVRQQGRMIDSFTLDPASFRTIALDPREFLKNPQVTITSSSDSTVLYKLALTFPRTDYAQSGYSNGFEVHKTIKNTDGSNTIKVGDIVEIKLKLNIKKPGSNYVVVDDPLPAGFVAINSAIKTEEAGVAQKKMKRMMQQGDEGNDDDSGSDGEFGEGFGWNDWYWDPSGYYRFTPNFMEVRNDRVVAFRNRAWNGIYEYSYYARAVCEGEFVMPSTKIQLMYDPEVVAYTPMGKVVIKGNK